MEFGCGTGKNTAAFARVARSVLGLDISPDMLAIATDRDLPPHVDLRVIRPDDPWPLPNASADVVTASLVLEHIEALAGVFEEVRRVLRPGGWFWLSELHPARQRRGSKAQFTGPDGRSWSPDCYLHELRDYTRAAEASEMRLGVVREPGDGAVPRLLVPGFERGAGPSG